MEGVHKVSSELYEENNFISELKPTFNPKNVVSKFPFSLPKPPQEDGDGDLVVTRRTDSAEHVLEIEHSTSTALNLVGLQIWRGALLLADWLIFNSEKLPQNDVILELGSGVGLTSIIAAKYRKVVCTDIDLGGLLDLIKHNVKRNHAIVQHDVEVFELNFLEDNFNKNVEEAMKDINIVLAADVVYDNKITEAFVQTVSKILKYPNKTVYVALEKRYVFTMDDFETCAPCYEHFLDCLEANPGIKKELVSLDFPQYFQYDRVKQLVLWKITST